MKPKKSEHTSIAGQKFYGTEQEFYLAAKLPYGRWTLADGREVLFNWFREPIWQRRLGTEATQVDPREPVPDEIVCTELFYADSHRHHEKREDAKRWLKEFRSGVRVTLHPETREYTSEAAAPGGGFKRRRSA